MDPDVIPTEPDIWTGLRPYLYVVLRTWSFLLRTFFPVVSFPGIDDYIKKRFGPPPAPLAVRAQEVSDALIRTGQLIDELQAEVKARMALIENLARQVQDADKRADEALRRAKLSEEDAKAVDAYLNRAVSEAEARSRRREWGLATFAGLLIGVGAIVIARFLFGF